MGTDYGMFSPTINRDPETKIRYGIVSQSNLDLEALDLVLQYEYDPSCPKCGEGLDHAFEEGSPCPECGHECKDDVYPEEPSRIVFSDKGVEGFVGSNGDVWVTKSPYVVRGKHCSPCAPGAVSVDTDSMSSDDSEPVGYCLPPDWYLDAADAAAWVKRGDDG